MTYKELYDALVEAGIEPDIRKDDEGQLVVHTGLKCNDHDSQAELENVNDEDDDILDAEDGDDDGLIDTIGD